MKIGYACIPLGVDWSTNRKMSLKNFSSEKFLEITNLNLEDLRNILEYNIQNNIYLFRISSDIIPFGSHSINNILWQKIFKNQLEDIGIFIKKNKIRVSMHPGQYTVLNSPSEEIVKRAIKDIEYHTQFLDSLSLDYSHKIVLHLGGGYNDKVESIKRFIKNFKMLSESAKKRLVIENDERIFNFDDVLYASDALNIPIVFDYFHHLINPVDRDLKEILSLAKKTWKREDGNIKIHYSEQSRIKKTGSHSEFIETAKFLEFYNTIKEFDPDIMLETKDKNISAIKCICLISGSKSELYNEWAKYKYLVMEKNYSLYKECSKILNTTYDAEKFYNKIDEALLSPFNEGNFKNTLLHIWGYFKDEATVKEENKFFELVNKKEFYKAKKFLYKLSKKYKVQYLIDSYYFIYDNLYMQKELS
ncbi:UV DNA damage repair endonuclease UvsE [Caloramator sp. CAR-1]|uniref:UV DNA damage repair endonuclease UvsE n=1 Tax=Caloramator sp. CAR-1 TaxID=3062777 RepID=UPI0026E4839E|nr:UV DNA damage repair endonuclease UvsE [Caloramator sp. CAR-1]MDO6353485.1 UV DNA damage repair endonuclease UvsE [Caloramator sp. CAR-1]